jgi:hypothetical protein
MPRRTGPACPSWHGSQGPVCHPSCSLLMDDAPFLPTSRHVSRTHAQHCVLSSIILQVPWLPAGRYPSVVLSRPRFRASGSQHCPSGPQRSHELDIRWYRCQHCSACSIGRKRQTQQRFHSDVSSCNQARQATAVRPLQILSYAGHDARQAAPLYWR